MKKKVLMTLLLGLCLTMAGCSQKTEETKTTETAGTTEAGGSEAETDAETDAETENASETTAGETAADGTESETGTEGTSGTAVAEEEPDYRALDYVTLGQYKALEVTVSSMEVTEEDIQEQYYNDCSTHDKLMQVTEGTVADGDVTNIDYVGSVDGVEFDGGTDKGVDLTIGSGTFISGFEEGLIGAKIGDKVDINVTFPENYRESTLAGKDAVFAVTVNFVKKTPELTDELVAEISDQTTTDEYRKALEEQISATKEATRESEVINGVLSLVYSGSTINGYPQEVVDYRVAQMKAYYQSIAEQASMEFEEFLQQQLQITEEQFDQQCPTIIKQSMVQELLLKAVAESEDMELTDEEYEEGLERYVASTGTESKETLLSVYSEAEIRKSILLDKALDFLKENATIKEAGETEETADSEGASGDETDADTESGTDTESETDTEEVTADTEAATTEGTSGEETTEAPSEGSSESTEE